MRNVNFKRKTSPFYDVDILCLPLFDQKSPPQKVIRELFENRVQNGWRLISEDTKIVEYETIEAHIGIYHFYWEN